MKKLIQFSSLLLMVVIFSGCRKLIDKYFPGNGDGGGARSCKITSINHGEIIYTFKYNSFGKLDSVVPNRNIVNDEGEIIAFQYDNAQRLIGMTRLRYSPHQVDLTHRYGYTGNQITGDTIYNRNDGNIWLGKLTYDAQGRVASETRELIYATIPGQQPFIWRDYSYDPNGNLLPEPGYPEIQYGDAKSPYRTDKLLQFLARDYSKNAPPARSVNAAGLPTAFIYPFNFFFYPGDGPGGTWMETSVLTYDCDE